MSKKYLDLQFGKNKEIEIHKMLECYLLQLYKYQVNMD